MVFIVFFFAQFGNKIWFTSIGTSLLLSFTSAPLWPQCVFLSCLAEIIRLCWIASFQIEWLQICIWIILEEIESEGHPGCLIVFHWPWPPIVVKLKASVRFAGFSWFLTWANLKRLPSKHLFLLRCIEILLAYYKSLWYLVFCGNWWKKYPSCWSLGGLGTKPFL